MTIREQLTQEIEQAPDALIEELLDFCLFIKQRKAKEQLSPATPQTAGILDLLAQVKEIQAQVPADVWEKLPHDGAINHEHYLYGSLADSR
jgi:hypothetical protein